MKRQGSAHRFCAPSIHRLLCASAGERRPRWFALCGAAWLLPLLLAGCFHKANPPQAPALAPPIADSAPVQPEPVASTPAAIVPAAPVPEMKPAAPQAKPPVKHTKPASKPAQVASNGGPGVSAIGQLSSGSPYDLRSQTSDSIAATERRLNGIGRRLSTPEQKTAAQIREFLKQARAALASGDVDGARTLAAKAKVLLSELNP